ncbi:MAG: LysR family transcriptional regulator [Alphaproteobacteria bacterium]|nr:LysR family transcriptional regulator [Alphaproteobacteria bacterium]
MELKWLEDFVCLVKAGSFSRASSERNVTQPAFSRRIRALEDWLGVTLIDRSSYPVTLTPYGEQFLPAAQEILQTSYRARDDFRLLTKAQPNTIKIVTLHTLSLYFLPQLVIRLLRAEADAKAEVITSLQGVDQHFDTLANGIADLLVTYGDDTFDSQWLNLSQLEEKVIGEDMLLPVVSAPFAKEHELENVEDTNRPVPFLAYASFSFSEKLVSPVAKQLGDRLQVVYENGLSESLKTFVMQDFGLAWLPKVTIEQELDRGEAVCVGGEDLFIDLNIKAYRNPEQRTDLSDALWRIL